MGKLSKEEYQAIGKNLIEFAKYVDEYIILPQIDGKTEKAMVKGIKKIGKKIYEGDYEKYIDEDEFHRLRSEAEEQDLDN